MGGDMLSAMKYISTVPFSGLFNWSVQYLNDSKIAFSKAYPMMRIGEFLKRNKTAVAIEDDKTYKRATIKVRNGGIFLRDEEKGRNIGTKNQFLISKGQFLLSKIDARNGAFGVVPDVLDGGIITGNFWTFDVDYSIVNPHYLTLLTTTQAFVSFCEQASNGTTNRHYLQEPLFLNIKVPVPSLEEQNKLLEEYNKSMQNAKDIEFNIIIAEANLKKWIIDKLSICTTQNTQSTSLIQYVRYSTINKWSTEDILKSGIYNFSQSPYNVIPIGSVVTYFEGGKTPSTSQPIFWGDDVYWVSAKDMKELYLENIKDRLSNYGVKHSKLRVYPAGTILGVFRSGILRHSFPICITTTPVTINQDLKAIGVDETLIAKKFFLYYLDLLQDLVLNLCCKKGVTVESISTECFLSVPIVCPPLDEQNNIVEHIDLVKTEILNQYKQVEEYRVMALQNFETQIFE